MVARSAGVVSLWTIISRILGLVREVLAAGIFGTDKSVLAQVKGIALAGVFAFTFAFALFFIIKSVMGLRVSKEEELKGLDLSEHDQEAYKGFQIFRVQ